jgi:hypothetical protein
MAHSKGRRPGPCISSSALEPTPTTHIVSVRSPLPLLHRWRAGGLPWYAPSRSVLPPMEAGMGTIACRFSRLTVFLSLLLFSLHVEGCKEDDATTAPTTSPSAAGHWVGTAHEDYGTMGTQDYSITADITQTGYTLGGIWLWTLTGPGSYGVGNHVRWNFKGQISNASVISIQDTSFIAVNWSGTGVTLDSYTARLSAKQDTIYGTRVLAYPTIYPIGTFVIVKK